MENYQPPFTMTEEITNLIVEIGEYVGSIGILNSMRKNPVLRRENRIKTIHSSLAIEHNSLSLEQVTDVIDGKHVWGPPQEIREVQNAYQAYEKLSDLDPYNIKNLLYAHKLMMDGLVKESGAFRKGNVGVYADDKLVHPGSPAKLVPELMHQLMDWLKKSKYHPLVKSCIFHYEFEFIHPFADGNGRTGRLWQSLILRQWKDIFAWLPVETLVHRNQQAYYDALHQSNLVGHSTQFVTFMLTMIRDALMDLHRAQMHDGNSDVAINVALNVVTNEDKLLALLKQDGSLTAKEMAASLNITYRQVQRIIAKLKDDNKLIRHGANKNGYWEVTGS